MRAVLIGLGGIGTHLVEPLCRTLAFSQSERAPKRVILVDGDGYEEPNRSRQKFTSAANKAHATQEWLAPLFPEITIEAKSHFVDAMNVFLFCREGDAVFLAVDNHATRKLLSDHLSTLSNGLLISGGNEEYDGNIQIYARVDGKDITPPLTWQHPEIEFPKDRNPAELSCTERAQQGAPQILSVNFTIASLMLNAYTLWLERGAVPYGEAYFDLRIGNVRAVKLRQAA